MADTRPSWRPPTLSAWLRSAAGIVLNIAFVAIKAFYGWKVDSLTSKLRPNPRQTYGWQRGTTLAAFANALLLLVACSGDTQLPFSSDPMLGCFGVAPQGFAMFGYDAARVALRGGDGPVLAPDLVVVGQRPEFHAVGFGALRQLLGFEGAVRDDGMAMEIGVEDVGHGFILGLTE